MTEHRGASRFLVVAALLGAAMVGLVVRLAVLHLGAGAQTFSTAAKTKTYKETLTVSRGRILDGSPVANILALNVGVKDIWADPAVITASNKVAEVAEALAPLLGLPAPLLVTNLQKRDRRFVYLARYVPDEMGERVAARKLLGIHQRDTTSRSYPQGPLLCHVLGFVNLDGVGSWGLEQMMDKYLKGTPGLIETRLDGRRHELRDRRIREVAPQDGANLVLTIDQNLQYILEKAMEEAITRNRAKAGFAIMQRVATGEILAMVSRPGFDPNRFREATDAQKINRCIGYVYEPGSTFKVGVIAAALNEGIVKPDTMFDTEDGRWLYSGKVLRDYHGYSRLDVADILKKSSNIGAAKIAIMLGNQRLDEYLRAFGIGRKLGIDLPGEEGGILRPVEKWAQISSSRIAIGQGVAVTGLQMLGMLCAIANDGVLMKPYVVKEVVAGDGTVLLRHEPEALGRPITPATATLMRRLLARVTQEGGTGVKACVDGFNVAGKTGTAQKPGRGGYSETDYMASFVGFLPAERPEFGMLVVLDEPQPLHTGGAVSAPVFGVVADSAARYLGLQPPPGAVVVSRKRPAADQGGASETF
jgi:cell division protein FtsI (penicillin-binding protein 3)